MRTNIEIDDVLMKKAMKSSRLETKTKKAVVEEALQLLVRSRAQEGVRKLFGRGQWDGDLEWLRTKDKWAESAEREREGGADSKQTRKTAA